MLYFQLIMEPGDLAETQPIENPLTEIYKAQILPILVKEGLVREDLDVAGLAARRLFLQRNEEDTLNGFRAKDNVPKMLLTAMVRQLSQQELTWATSHQLTTSGESEAPEFIVAGLLKRKTPTIQENTPPFSSGPVRQGIPSAELAKYGSQENRHKLYELYLTKVGDCLRAFFDGRSPNGSSGTGNFIHEARTLATLQLALEGNEGVTKKLQSQNFQWEQGRNIVRSIPLDLKPLVTQRTTEFISRHLWLLNSVIAITEADPKRASRWFTFLAGQEDQVGPQARDELKRIEITALEYHHSGFLRPMDQGPDYEQENLWQPFTRAVKELFQSKTA